VEEREEKGKEGVREGEKGKRVRGQERVGEQRVPI